MTQIGLDFTPRASNSDPDTSHQAAHRVPNFAAGHYAKILGSLKLHGPQTIYELAANTGLSHVQIARRLPELGDVAGRTGEKRLGPSGCSCGVWGLK